MPVRQWVAIEAVNRGPVAQGRSTGDAQQGFCGVGPFNTPPQAVDVGVADCEMEIKHRKTPK